jgi:hypothetical protein
MAQKMTSTLAEREAIGLLEAALQLLNDAESYWASAYVACALDSLSSQGVGSLSRGSGLLADDGAFRPVWG